ncbi:hypothetical protein PFICI_04053 [Pestalotiopsis fici W106-1]|uniref:FAR1 domain-containing protein n=1 Tax=Pestalotiopsis fici (strain W106-1 / CGMCC3.15140) TaxID=1229662 RepID=W3XIY4_PESFW|nr:uncharacterized protein PFICI_04053 [Pestalotiopsis fici W106-1]ETS86028.1 hypothetical protein PFICI_04053 [Pestalotiopsis fici W106-1]
MAFSIRQYPSPRRHPRASCLPVPQRVAKDQGYGVVKLRASNYRDGKPTRYDLVCDRGGVKYNSTAKKRNPSTRKVDCPWRAKAVCEVSLANQWRFAVQDARHNHEARVPAAPPGQENTPLAQSIRSLTNKLDRISHDMSQGLGRISSQMENIEKRLVDVEQRVISMDTRMSGMEQRDGEMGVLSDNMTMEGSMLGQADEVVADMMSTVSSAPAHAASSRSTSPSDQEAQRPKPDPAYKMYDD